MATSRTYVPEKPCKRGHALRYASTGACVECRREQWRRFASQNPDKAQGWAIRNPDKRRATNLAWHEKHPEIRRGARQRWLDGNAEKARQQNRQWHIDNRERVNANKAKRRAAKLQRTPPWLSDDQHWMMREAYALAELRTQVTGVAWHVDHVVPLQGEDVSGLHVPWNLRVIPAKENLSKRNFFDVREPPHGHQ